MKNFTCPRCHREGISLKNKLLADLWLTIHCSECESSLCSQPWVIAILYVVYTWVVLWFAAMVYYNDSLIYIAYMVVVLAIFETISVLYMPMMVLRSGRPPKDT